MTSRLFIAAIAILSAVCPIANAFCVIELLVGISRLKTHYWIEHGVYLSVGSNLLVWLPMTLARDSVGPVWHGVLGLMLVNVVSFVAYFLFTAALLS
jgi:hypothetical protein